MSPGNFWFDRLVGAVARGEVITVPGQVGVYTIGPWAMPGGEFAVVAWTPCPVDHVVDSPLEAAEVLVDLAVRRGGARWSRVVDAIAGKVGPFPVGDLVSHQRRAS